MPANPEHKRNVLQRYPNAVAKKDGDEYAIFTEPGGQRLGSGKAPWVAWKNAEASL